MLSLLYRAQLPTGSSADPAEVAAEASADRSRFSADQTPSSAEVQRPSAVVLTKRAQAERVYAELSADGTPPSSAQLAAAAGLSPSYARALVAQFQGRPPAAAGQGNGHPRSWPA